MNTIAVCQPWASLIEHGFKTTFSMMFQWKSLPATFVIASSNRIAPVGAFEEFSIWKDLAQIDRRFKSRAFRISEEGRTALPMGVALAKIEIIKAVQVEEAPESLREENEKHGNIGLGEWLWVVGGKPVSVPKKKVRIKGRVFQT